MDLDEWELIPSTKSFKQRRAQAHAGFASTEPAMLGPALFVETNYFKLPGPGPAQGGEEEEIRDSKDIPISPEFDVEIKKETPAPAPAPAPASASAPAAAPTAPVNWLEPDPSVFERGMHDGDAQGSEARKAEEKECVGFTLWGLPLPVHGIAAICSFSVATAATLCVFALGNAASSSASWRLRANPSIQLQIYSDDKVPSFSPRYH